MKISDFLLTGNVELGQLAKDIGEVGYLFIPAFLIISAIWENLTNYEYTELIKRLLFAIVIGSFGTEILSSGVKLSMEVADTLTETYASESIILKPFNKEGVFKDNGSKKTSWDNLSSGWSGIVSSFWAEAMFLLAYGALWIIGIFYTLVYSILLVGIPFMSALSLFPPTRRAMEAIIFSSVWCMLTPIICTIVLCVLHQMTGIKTNVDGLPALSTLEYMIQYLCMVVIVLYAPMITTAIMSGKGVHHVGEKLLSGTANTVMTLGKGLVLGKAMAGAAAMGGLSMSALRMGAGGVTSWGKSKVQNGVSGASYFRNQSKRADQRYIDAINAGKFHPESPRDANGLSQYNSRGSGFSMNTSSAKSHEAKPSHGDNHLGEGLTKGTTGSSSNPKYPYPTSFSPKTHMKVQDQWAFSLRSGGSVTGPMNLKLDSKQSGRKSKLDPQITLAKNAKTPGDRIKAKQRRTFNTYGNKIPKLQKSRTV